VTTTSAIEDSRASLLEATDRSLRHVMLAGLGRLIARFLDEVAATGVVSTLTLHDGEGRLFRDAFDSPDPPDLVFTANAGFICGDKVVPSHFMPHERRPEEPYIKQWFADRGYDLKVLPDDIGFEGAGDCLIDRNGPWLWTGYGFRTELTAHPYLDGWFDYEVVSIRLTDPRFYHIDTCFCPLSGGFLLFYPDAFDADSVAAIEQRVAADRRIPIDAEAAANFSCNAVNVGQHIFAHRFSTSLEKRLNDLGFQLHETPLTEFLKSGGSAKCLTLKMSEPETL
jgi:N-dimethylarginine dimethylaminohydrolase